MAAKPITENLTHILLFLLLVSFFLSQGFTLLLLFPPSLLQPIAVLYFSLRFDTLRIIDQLFGHLALSLCSSDAFPQLD